MVISTFEVPCTMLLRAMRGFERPKVLKISGYVPSLDLPKMDPPTLRIAAEMELSFGCVLLGLLTELNENVIFENPEVPKLYVSDIT